MTLNGTSHVKYVGVGVVTVRSRKPGSGGRGKGGGEIEGMAASFSEMYSTVN